MGKKSFLIYCTISLIKFAPGDSAYKNPLKAAKYEIQKPSTWRGTLFLFKFRFDVSCFSSRENRILLRVNLIARDEKRETSNLNLNRKNVARQVEGFCISYFAAFMIISHGSKAHLD